MGRESGKSRGSTDWDELMRTMLKPSPNNSRCKVLAPSGVVAKSKKSKKKTKQHRRCEPKYEFLLCSVFRSVFGCSRDQSSSIKMIAQKLKNLESKVNEIEKKCTDRVCTVSSPVRSPPSPSPSPPRSPPRSPLRSPPKTPPPLTPEASPPPQEMKSAVTQSEGSYISVDSRDSYEIKGLRVRKEDEMKEFGRESETKSLKGVDVKPTDVPSSVGRVHHSVKERRNSPRYSLELFNKRSSIGSGGRGSVKSAGVPEEPNPQTEQRRITQYFHEERSRMSMEESKEFIFQLKSVFGNILISSTLSEPSYVDRTPEIEPSSSTSIPTYIVQNEKEHIYESHGTGKVKLRKHLKLDPSFKSYRSSQRDYVFPMNSSGTCIYDMLTSDDSQDNPFRYITPQKVSFEKDTVFKCVAKNEKIRPVCFASPVSSSSESLLFEHVCVVKSKSIPVLGRRIWHKEPK